MTTELARHSSHERLLSEALRSDGLALASLSASSFDAQDCTQSLRFGTCRVQGRGGGGGGGVQRGHKGLG